jgi:hypothetical protein
MDQSGRMSGSGETVRLADAAARAVQRHGAAFDSGERAALRAALDDIQAQADLAADAIATLVDVARASFACSEPTARRLVCLNDLVIEELRELGERARVGGGVSVALDPTLPSVAGDWRQLRSVLHTLLVALMQEREASGDANPITVQTSHAAGVLQGERIARVALAGAAGRTPPAGTLTMERAPNPALAVPLAWPSIVSASRPLPASSTSSYPACLSWFLMIRRIVAESSTARIFIVCRYPRSRAARV